MVTVIVMVIMDNGYGYYYDYGLWIIMIIMDYGLL